MTESVQTTGEKWVKYNKTLTGRDKFVRLKTCRNRISKADVDNDDDDDDEEFRSEKTFNFILNRF